MWFDPHKALAEIQGGGNTPADTLSAQPETPPRLARLARLARPLPQNPGTSPPISCDVLARYGRKGLPMFPPICAGCGLADWQVSVTEPDGTRLHVPCWITRTLAPLNTATGPFANKPTESHDSERKTP